MGSAPTLVIDFGTTTAAAMVVIDQGAWPVPDPATGTPRWPCSIHWDGQSISAGAAAEQRGQADPGGYSTDIRRALWQDRVVTVGTRRVRPVEQVAEFFAVLRSTAQRMLGSISQGGVLPGPLERAIMTVPASLSPADALRSQLVGAGEGAGFTAVELLLEPAAAVWAPGSPLKVGDTALVYDLGATFEAALIRVGDDLPEVLGHTSIVDWPADPTAAVESTLAACRDLLDRSGVHRAHVRWLLPIGGGARAAGLPASLEGGLGIAVAELDEPELAIVRGAAAWLPRSGPRSVPARVPAQRTVPLVFTFPGDHARLLRWLVEPRQGFDEGAVVARIRLAGGAIWDLTARTRGTVDELLVPSGQDVRSGDWLALVHPT